jgi:hypothetical protein
MKINLLLKKQLNVWLNTGFVAHSLNAAKYFAPIPNVVQNPITMAKHANSINNKKKCRSADIACKS